MKADLHMHSTASDGRLAPAAVMEAAAKAGLEIVSLTDHDTVMGLQEAKASALSLGMDFVVGAEVSSVTGGEEVHLLSYGFDEDNAGMLDFLELQRSRRDKRAIEFVRRFKSAGLLPASAELPELGHGRSIARPHIAALLVAAGTVDTHGEAFEVHLSPGGEHFVEKPMPSGAEVIDTVHSAGGVVVLAHPGHRTSHQTVVDLVAAGLDGIEVVHPSHDGMLTAYYRALASRVGLFCTGGSDYHAREDHGGSSLGEFWIDMDEELRRSLRTQ